MVTKHRIVECQPLRHVSTSHRRWINAQSTTTTWFRKVSRVSDDSSECFGCVAGGNDRRFAKVRGVKSFGVNYASFCLCRRGRQRGKATAGVSDARGRRGWSFAHCSNWHSVPRVCAAGASACATSCACYQNRNLLRRDYLIPFCQTTRANCS